MELDLRKQSILKAIIEEYTATGEPVGSKRICSLLEIAVSPATVRNDMAALFEMGLLEQPHTSAGRIPSHLGYRYYLDHLMQCSDLNPWERAEIQAMFNIANPDPDLLLQDAAQALANFTHCAAIFSTSTPKSVRVRRVELIAAAGNSVIIMVIATNGVIKSKVCRVPFQVNTQLCAFFTSFANTHLSGKTLEEISSSYLNSVVLGMEEYASMFHFLLTPIYELCREIHAGQFYTKGQTNLLTYPEMGDCVGDLLIFLEHQQKAQELIPKGGQDIQIIVGKENSRMEFSNSSVVIVRYAIGGNKCGAIGIIGPVRMDYARLIPHMECFAQTLGELLSETLEQSQQNQ